MTHLSTDVEVSKKGIIMVQNREARNSNVG
jgi:hypothetical protein